MKSAREKTTEKYLLVFFAVIVVILPNTVFAREEKAGRTYRITDGDGYSQIAYEKNGVEKIITNDKSAHATPVTNGKVIAWSAQNGSLWNIFYYDIHANYTIQLSHQGNNVDPQISDGYIVWEGQRNNIWQIFVFDGVRVKQVSEGSHPAQNTHTSNGYITYSQKNKEGEWKIFLYNLETQKVKAISPNLSGRSPRIDAGKVSWEVFSKNDEETTYYTYDIKTEKTFFEGLKTGRKKYITKLEKELQNFMQKKAVKKPETVEKTIIEVPSPQEPPQVTIDDVREELGIKKTDTPEKEPAKEITEAEETSPSAREERKKERVEKENVKESTTSDSN